MLYAVYIFTLQLSDIAMLSNVVLFATEDGILNRLPIDLTIASKEFEIS